MSSTMDRNEIIRCFTGCIHCSQIVVGQWAEILGLDVETSIRMAGPFGGGCFAGNVCGCVAGALMVIGAEFGHCQLGDEAGNAQMIEKIEAFKAAYKERFGALNCRELIGYDFSKQGEFQKAQESGVFFQKCPDFVNGALEILDEIMG